MKCNSLTYQLQFYFGKLLIRLVELWIAIVVERKIFIPSSKFGWTARLEQHYPQIKAEYEAVNQSLSTLDITYISEEQKKVVAPNSWSMYVLKNYNHYVVEHCERCPITHQCLQLIPDCVSAYFSIMNPQTNISSHRGPFKGFLRYHLGLKIPKNNQQCAIQFDSESYHWSEAESVVFDDTYYHIAYNHSKETRAILYIDFVRPLPEPLLSISKFIIAKISESAYVKNMRLK